MSKKQVKPKEKKRVLEILEQQQQQEKISLPDEIKDRFKELVVANQISLPPEKTVFDNTVEATGDVVVQGNLTVNGKVTFSIDCSQTSNFFIRVYEVFRFIFTGKATF